MTWNIFKYEFKRQFFRKANIIFFLFMFLYLFFVEFVNIYLIGPMGLFSNSNLMKVIVNGYGAIMAMPPVDGAKLLSSFSEFYSDCNNACGQLARQFFDNLGFVFYMGSFLIGSFSIGTKQKDKDRKELKLNKFNIVSYIIGKYLAIVIYSMTVLSMISFLPFILSFRLKEIGYTGNPFEYIKYLWGWILPTVCILFALQMLFSVIFTETSVGIVIHFALALLMINPDVKNYPIYKLLIRFNGVSEEFYDHFKIQILFNRIFIGIMAIVMIAIVVYIFYQKDKDAEELI